MAIGAAAMGAIGSISGGVSAQNAANDQSAQVREEARENRKRSYEDLERFEDEQELSYLSSGVLLEGSPLLVLKETQEKGSADISGEFNTQMNKASAIRKTGRDRFVGSLFQAGSMGASASESAPKAKQ